MRFLKGSCPMMFDVKNRFLNIDFFSFHTRNFVTPIINRGAHTCKIRPYPTGRLLGVAMFQAFRARLRSVCPYGTRLQTPRNGI